VTPQASIALLFVAAGLLVLAGVGIGRARGRAPSERDAGLMAAMTGIAVAFLFIVMPVIPLVVFPMVIAGILLAGWLAERRWLPLGAFLIGSGLFLAVTQALRRANDLADPAVTNPLWSPVPLAIGAAVTILGVTLVVVALRTNERPRKQPPPA
jgi:hypothetical protein